MHPQRTSPAKDNAFTKGAIVRVHLKDFMTFNEVEFFPGPNLNLILGPNGTGKSTLVSAICLGMAGKPSTIARASKLSGYVRHGADKAIINIELHNPDGQNYCITREIFLNNKSTWKFQGKPISNTQIEEIVRKLHIQVDNLCQFLPQEKVQHFSRLKDKQLLTGTMKAVGNPELAVQFDQLIQMQSALDIESLNQEKDELELRKLQQENKRWESEVKSFQEREILKANVKTLKKKKSWLKFVEKLRRFDNLKVKAKEIGVSYERAQAHFQPLKKLIAKKEETYRKTEAAEKTMRDKFNLTSATANNEINRAEAHKQKMESLAVDFQTKKAAEIKRRDNDDHFRQQILSLEKELEALDGQENNATSELIEIDMKLKEIVALGTTLTQRKLQITEEIQNFKYAIHEYQSKVKNVEDVDKNRLSLLRGDHGLLPIYNAVMWLRDNKNKFRAPIHEPPMISLIVKNTEMAKYVENSIGFNDLQAFFCENKDDMNDLIRILREEKQLPINVVHAPTSDQPLISEFQPRIALSDLKHLGFHSFVRELFVGPEPVVRYLCKMYKVHNIPVGDQRAYDNFGVIRDQFGSFFPTFFGENQLIVIKSSRYRKELITQMSDIRPSKFLGHSVDTCVLEQYYAKITQMQHRLAEAKTAEDEINQEEMEANKNCDELLNRKRSLLGIKASRRVVMSRLERVRELLKISETDAVDLVAEEKNVKEQCGAAVRSLTENLKEFAKLTDQLLVLDKDAEVLLIYLNVLRVEIVSAKKKLAKEEGKIESLREEKNAADNLVNRTKYKARQAQANAFRCLNIRVKEDITNEISDQFKSLPKSIQEIDNAIISANARIQLMGSADEQILREYEKREAFIEQLSRKIYDSNSQASSLKNKMDKLKGEFLPHLLQLISHINNNFGRYYASMNCVGEVCLYTGEGDIDDDFKNYGIKIRVKYRSAEPLLDLSPNRHSGGERAVATALYMLAMQELTQVPFRCVDEINQGMDPINERRVFDLLVETACRETSAQYFLLTPKLLPGLDYSPNMMVHFVLNRQSVRNN